MLGPHHRTQGVRQQFRTGWARARTDHRGRPAAQGPFRPAAVSPAKKALMWKCSVVTRESPVDARCWAGFSDRVLGIGVGHGVSEVEVPADTWPKFTSVGGVLAVLRGDSLDLRDGKDGGLRVQVPAPFASDVRASNRRFWLDEDGRARPVSIDGQQGEPVELRGAHGLVAASDRWLAGREAEAFDNSTIKVVSTSGAKGVVLTTPSLANPTSAAFTADGLVVAHNGGIQCWPLDGQPPRLIHKAPVRLGLVQILPTDVGPDHPDWYVFCEDVLSETTMATGEIRGGFRPVQVTGSIESRLTRFSEGQPVGERIIEGRALGLAFEAGLLWVLTSKTKSDDLYGGAGPVECRILDDRLDDVGVVDFGDADWRGGFAVCSGQPI